MKTAVWSMLQNTSFEFTVEESCGQCTPCRDGTRRMLEILERISQLEKVLWKISTSERSWREHHGNFFCGLGQTAPQPVISTMRYFWNEYEAHVKEGRCPAKKCKSLTCSDRQRKMRGLYCLLKSLPCKCDKWFGKNPMK